LYSAINTVSFTIEGAEDGGIIGAIDGHPDGEEVGTAETVGAKDGCFDTVG